MVQETGLKLRTRLESAKTLKARNGGSETCSAGDMLKLHDTIGVVVEAAAENQEFVLVYEAEKIVAPKSAGTGVSFETGGNVYYDAAAQSVTNAASGNTLCGKALEAAADNDDEVLIDLMVLA